MRPAHPSPPGTGLATPGLSDDGAGAVFGAVDYSSGQVTWQLHPKKGGDAFVAFLAQIAQTWPEDQLVLVMDNVSYHRAATVRTWWAEQEGHITAFWLPVYTPNLNLMERVWRFLKQKLACHRFWAEVEGLEAAAAHLLDHLEAHFHTDDPPGIYLVKKLMRSRLDHTVIVPSRNTWCCVSGAQRIASSPGGYAGVELDRPSHL